MNTATALARLAMLAAWDLGPSSDAARSVLLACWNGALHPVRGWWTLDAESREAAAFLLNRPFPPNEDLLENFAPQIRVWSRAAALEYVK